MSWQYYKLYWLLALIPYGIYCLFKYLDDQTSVEKIKIYLEPDVIDNDLSIVKIENLEQRHGLEIFNWEDEDVYACCRSPIFHVYSVYKKLLLVDKNGTTYNVFVSVDFRGFHNRKLKRLRWKPDLRTLKNNEK